MLVGDILAVNLKPFFNGLSGERSLPSSFRARDTADGLKVLGMLADTSIVLRDDHQDAIGTGMGVTEIAPLEPLLMRSADFGLGYLSELEASPMSSPRKVNVQAIIAGDVAGHQRIGAPAGTR